MGRKYVRNFLPYFDVITGNINNIASVRLGNGDGTFSLASTFTMAGTSTANFLIADLNGDQYGDLISSSFSGNQGAWIHLSNGNGTFLAPTTIYAATNVPDIFAGDLNRDDTVDVVVATNTYSYLNIPRQTTTLARVNLLSQSGAQSAITAMQSALDRITREQGSVGALMSRAEVVARSLTTGRDHLSGALSRVRDADIASDLAQFIKNSILEKSIAAVLAQANQSSRVVLTLLGSASE